MKSHPSTVVKEEGGYSLGRRAPMLLLSPYPVVQATACLSHYFTGCPFLTAHNKQHTTQHDTRRQGTAQHNTTSAGRRAQDTTLQETCTLCEWGITSRLNGVSIFARIEPRFRGFRGEKAYFSFLLRELRGKNSYSSFLTHHPIKVPPLYQKHPPCPNGAQNQRCQKIGKPVADS